MPTVKQNISTWYPSAIVILAVIYLTCWPNPLHTENIPIFPGADKIVHAIMFGGLVGALNFDYYRSRHILPVKTRIIFLISSIVLGGITELVQSLDVVGRSCDVLDFCADAAGSVIAFFSAPPVVRAIFRKS